MKYQLSLTVLLVSILTSYNVLAQRGQQLGSKLSGAASQAKPRQQAPEPKIPRDFRPSMLKLSYDMIPLGTTVFSEKRSGQGFQASVDFDQFFLSAEYGTQQSKRGETFDYQSSGWYWSIGPEANFLRKNTKGHSISFGLRYGQSRFSDKLTFQMDTTFFSQGMTVEASNEKLKASWLEMTLGMSAKVWKQMYMGYTVRYKVFRTVKCVDGFAPYDVPGFGLYEDNTGVQFNYYIGWAFQWREKFPEKPPISN